MSVFINTLTEFYKPMPYGPGFIKNLTPLMDQLSPEAQEHAAQGIIRGRKAKGWPSLTECEKALRLAIEPPRAATGDGSFKSSAEVRSDHIAANQMRIAAFRLCRCAMGREAHEGRWLNAMIDFCTDNGRLPHGREVTTLKELAARNDQAAADSARLFPAFLTMREAMHERAYRDVWGFIDGQREEPA
jgi:hypothetical protein